MDIIQVRAALFGVVFQEFLSLFESHFYGETEMMEEFLSKLTVEGRSLGISKEQFRLALSPTFDNFFERLKEKSKQRKKHGRTLQNMSEREQLFVIIRYLVSFMTCAIGSGAVSYTARGDRNFKKVNEFAKKLAVAEASLGDEVAAEAIKLSFFMLPKSWQKKLRRGMKETKRKKK